MALSDVMATFTPNGNTPLPFAVFVGQDGIPIDSPQQLEEMLTTPGVDYARWRDVHKQFPSKRFMTWAECLSTIDYQNRMRLYMTACSLFGTLTHVFRGVSTTWKNVKCEGMMPLAPIPSGIFGFGSGGGPVTAAAIFTFRLTEVSSVGSGGFIGTTRPL